jgi:hypothetical protein
MERYPSDPAGWGMAIDLLCELATEEDVRRLSKYCSDPKYSKYLGEDDSEIFKSWVAAFIGEIKYYLIRYGISGRFKWEREEEDPSRRFKVNDNTGVDYHRAYHQWNAFCGWMKNHSEVRESYNQFEVSSIT